MYRDRHHVPGAGRLLQRSAELEAEGVRVGRKRVARLMRGAGLAKRRSAGRSNFTAEAPDRLWVADIT